MPDIRASTLPEFDLLDRATRTSVTLLNAADPSDRSRAHQELLPLLAGADHDHPLQSIIRTLEVSGSERTRAGIAELRKLQQPASSLDVAMRVAEVATTNLDNLVLWVRQNAENPAIAAMPDFAMLVAAVRTRGLCELPDELGAIRKKWDELTDPPFSRDLRAEDWAQIAKHIIPGSADAHTLADERALELLVRRIARLRPDTEEFIKQIALVATDPDWKADSDQLGRIHRVMGRMKLSDEQIDKFAQLIAHVTKVHVAGKSDLANLSCLVSVCAPAVSQTLALGEGHPALTPLRDDIQKLIGDPPVAHLNANQADRARSLGALAVLSGLHGTNTREWLERAIHVGKECEAGSVPRSSFLVVWEFLAEPLTRCEFGKELAQRVQSESIHFNPNGSTWTDLEAFCHEFRT